MPPGMDVVKIGNSSLRTNGTTVTMRTRHSTSLLVSVSPKTAMLKRRRTDLKPPTPTLQKRRSAPVRNGEEENQEVLDRVLPRNGVNPSKPSKTSKLSRKGVHPAAEIYSKKLYRQVATGFDMDEGSDTELPETSSRAVITDNWRPEYSWGTQELAHPDAIPQMEIDDDGFILDEKPAFILPTKLIACDVTTPYATDPEIFMTPPVSPQAYNYEFTAHDEVFLVRLNEQRKLASGKEYLDIKTFCTVIKCLEELTFLKIHDYLLDNLHAVYTRPPERGSEDEASVPCDVCGIAECDKDDEMVFCDMCHTCVHMCCAGILTLPPEYEQWKCLKCENTNTPSPKCHLCPCLGGSMTSNADKSLWAHHVCALFHPEVIFEDWERRWPMKELDKILPERWTDVCSVCDTRMGACIGCVEPGCDETFHVCCALRAGLTVRIQEVCNLANITVFCARDSAQSAKSRGSLQRLNEQVAKDHGTPSDSRIPSCSDWPETLRINVKNTRGHNIFRRFQTKISIFKIDILIWNFVGML
uniref:Histone-lysine N-methyltransferase n=1 Tax=Caenorhabditis japonica TaxID=281687 RepID=A0A8R1DEJ0_CAEJA